MIKHVIHIADLHIPNKYKDRPYMDMIKVGLAEVLKVTKEWDKDEFRIVLVGDVFHNKINITNEARQVFHDTLNYLNAIGKTIIIAGNHDMLENNHDRMDSISPTFDIKDAFPNITYADKEMFYQSGYFKDDNVIWVLYSMFDKFERPNIDGLKAKYPDCRIIGLYHGDVIGSVTDTGRVSENGTDGKIFNGCDCVMAGHIHRYQTIKKQGVQIVYSGSMFQQNAGENTTGHGFVVWDLEDMGYKLHEVSNKYKIYKFKIKSYDDIKNDTEKLLNL